MTLQSGRGIADTNVSFPDEFIELFNLAAVRNVKEATAVLFHAFLLQTDFIPKDVSHADIFKLMPKDWNAKSIFKIKYSHNCCPSFTCYVTIVPLYDNVSVHGIVCDSACSESVNLKMNFSKYIKQKEDFSNICKVFDNVDELSRYIKDSFCLPLLNLLHETVGGKRLYGFSGLYDDLKILFLTVLPVESVVSMSSVNKSWHYLANLPFLWKYLFNRDYAKDGIHEIQTSSQTDWKELYKKEYIKKNRKPEQRDFTFPYYRLPPLMHMPPDMDIDFDIDSPFSGFPPPLIPPFSSHFQPLLPPRFSRRFF